MNSFETIKLARLSETSATLTLARPDRRNAINPRMAEEIQMAITEIVDWGVQVAVLGAEGTAFCGGVDLTDLQAGGAALDHVVASFSTAPIHWTAVVTGAARGGALAILAACPRVIASVSSTFGLPELSKGFFPTDLMVSQAETIGARRAFELAFHASPIGAEEALRIGLVSEVVADDAVARRIAAVTAALASADRQALRAGIAAWQSFGIPTAAHN